MRIAFIFILLIGCTSRTADVVTNVASEREIPSGSPGKSDILGVWTDGSGPNASFLIEGDSVHYVELFITNKYTYAEGVMNIYHDDRTHTSKITMPHPDTMIWQNEDAKITYWRFKD